MTMDRQKRSSSDGMTNTLGQAQGVGGRHGDRCPAGGGAGYQDICTEQTAAVRDPRMGELADCGLSPIWRTVASEIGVDAFLRAWEVLSEHPQVQDDCGRVHVPSHSTWLRYQRNLVIATRAGQGWTAADIQQELRDRLGYDLTRRYISQLMRQSQDD